MSRFNVKATVLAGLSVATRMPIGDSRGYLERMYCAEEMEALLGGRSLMQVNRTYTANVGTVRGMHYQLPPHAETKLVSCLHGEVYDVAVDLRRDSPTFLQWHAERLSAENKRTMVIPEGFAHGLQALTNDCELLYFHTSEFVPSAEGGLDALDVSLGIDWPLPVAERSLRDEQHPPLNEHFQGVPL